MTALFSNDQQIRHLTSQQLRSSAAACSPDQRALQILILQGAATIDHLISVLEIVSNCADKPLSLLAASTICRLK